MGKPVRAAVTSYGYAPEDCGNRSAVNVSFTFVSKPLSGGIPPWIVAAQEAGHAWGLSHVDTECDAMGGGYSKKGCKSGAWRYVDEESRTIPPLICPGQATQNSHQFAIANLGAWADGTPKPAPGEPLCRDKAPPEVKTVEPVDGASVPATFTVAAEASDDCPPVRRARITLPEIGLEAELGAPPFRWVLRDIADREALHITVEVWDGAGASARVSITVRIRSGPPGDGGADGGLSGDAEGNGAAGGNGCSCALGADVPTCGPWFLVAFAVAGSVAKRRTGRTRALSWDRRHRAGSHSWLLPLRFPGPRRWKGT